MSCNRTFARLQVLPLKRCPGSGACWFLKSERCEFCNSVFRKFTKCLLVYLVHQGGFPAELNLECCSRIAEGISQLLRFLKIESPLSPSFSFMWLHKC